MPCLRQCAAQLVGATPRDDHVAHVVVHDQQLVHARCGPCSRCCCTCRSPRRSRTSCRCTSSGVRFSSISCSRRRLVLGPAVLADLAHQPLGQDASTVAVMRNGSTPMSRSRVIELGASLVCSVLNTRCPVSDACTAIWAVSRSRISPTRMLSGSCRRIARRAGGERQVDLVVDRALDDAVDVVLDRVLGGDDLVGDRRSARSAPSRAWSSCRRRSARSPGRCRWAC